MVVLDFFAYQWSSDEYEEINQIRIYGITKENKNVYIRVDNFPSSCYVEIPDNIEGAKTELIRTRLSSIGRGSKKPLEVILVKKKKLYFSWKKKKEGKYKDLLFPFFYVTFNSASALQSFSYLLKREIDVNGIGKLKLNIHEAEGGVSPVLKLLATRKIPACGWIRVDGTQIKGEDKWSSFKYELSCSYLNLFPLEESRVIHPKVLSIDIEANSTVTSAMPDATKPNDKVFQVACVAEHKGKVKKHLFTLGQPDERVGKDVILHKYKTESELLLAVKNFIREEDFNVITGYNILGWDCEYMIKRAKFTSCFSEFRRWGCLCQDDKEAYVSFASKAYSKEKLVYLDSEGRLYIDLLPIIKRNHKIVNYRLNTVTEYFGIAGKDPLTPQDIFRCYREFTPEALSLVGKYCVNDAYITLLLYQKTHTWFGLCEMAKTTHVPIFYTFTKGTQIQMYSQVLDYCYDNNYVVISNGYVCKEDEEYAGATVLNPYPGKYKKVLSFDFASLYPSIMLAYNIDYSTLVPEGECYVVDIHSKKYQKWNKYPCFLKVSSPVPEEYKPEIITEIYNEEDMENKIKEWREEYPNIPFLILRNTPIIEDKDTHVFAWCDHINCEHDDNRKRLKNGEFSKAKDKKVICGANYFRFMKEAVVGKGVIPSLLTSLITRRKNTRKEIVEIENQVRALLVKLIRNEYDITEYKNTFKKLLEDIDTDEHKESIDDVQAGEIASKLDDLNILIHILDKRQSSYKVCANSMYGAMGVKRGYLPLMPGASSVTYRGRKSLEFISKYIPDKYNGITVYGDSVTGDTPLLVKYDDGTVDIKRIDEVNTEWRPYEQFKRGDDSLRSKEQSSVKFSIWTGKKWSRVIRVIRHQSNKKIYRVSTSRGTVDVSEDHSLIDIAGKQIKPTEIDTSTELLHSFPFEFPNEKDRLQKDEAFFWGVSYYLRYEVLPSLVFNSSLPIRRAFFDGCVQANKSLEFICKGKIKAQGMYYLIKSVINLNLKSVVIEEVDFDTFKVIITDKKYSVKSVKVKRLFQVDNQEEKEGKKEEFIYDLETEQGVFHAGIGELILKNTDSAMVYFPHITNNKDAVELADKITGEIQKYFPPPMKLEFEKIYEKYLILTKKRYIAEVANKKGEIIDTVKKGIVLVRREHCKCLRDIYLKSSISLLNDEKEDKILNDIVDGLLEMFHFNKKAYTYKDFVLTKTVNTENYKSKTLPVHVEVARRMKARGVETTTGSRIEYLFTTRCQDTKDFKQGEKAEDLDNFRRWRSYFRIDYLYYIEKQMIKPLDELLKVGIGRENFVKSLYLVHKNKHEINKKIREMSYSNIVLETDSHSTDIDTDIEPPPKAPREDTANNNSKNNSKNSGKKDREEEELKIALKQTKIRKYLLGLSSDDE